VRKIPEFLPPIIDAFMNRNANVLGGAVGIGTNIIDTSHVVAPTQMELLMYQSPALIHGLLMTQVKMADGDVQCFFFGYRCVACETVYLVHNRIRQAEDLYEFSIHQCDPSEIRRAVRNARNLGRSRDEYVMEHYSGGFSYGKKDVLDRKKEFSAKYLNEPFVNDHVYSREYVDMMLSSGNIDITQADKLLNMRYETRDRKIDHER
jgi:hypothetical protein